MSCYVRQHTVQVMWRRARFTVCMYNTTASTFHDTIMSVVYIIGSAPKVAKGFSRVGARPHAVPASYSIWFPPPLPVSCTMTGHKMDTACGCIPSSRTIFSCPSGTAAPSSKSTDNRNCGQQGGESRRFVQLTRVKIPNAKGPPLALGSLSCLNVQTYLEHIPSKS